jgi:hypothetical protein
MKFYLVVARFRIDDVPLRLFGSLQEAIDYCSSYEEGSEEEEFARELFNTPANEDGNMFYLLAITCFQDGFPIDSENFELNEQASSACSKS